MREILFKAKRIDNGEWVEGNLIITPKADEDFKAIIIPFNDNGEYIECAGDECLGFETWYKVDMTTICQYTGLTDKNGNKIWENDVVGEYSEYKEEWCFAKVTYGHFNCSCCDGVYGWTFENGDIRCHKIYEVKGNIFDNPELIGV